MKPLTLSERVYLARYYHIDGVAMMGAAFNRSPQSITRYISTMVNNGEYELYRKLSDSEYEKILNCAEVKHGAIEKHDHQ